MNQKYLYSILKYKHSAALGESLNVGVLFYFVEEKHFEFIYSKNLHRIKCAYDEVSEYALKEYLREIKYKTKYLNNPVQKISSLFDQIFDDFDAFIHEIILPEDSSSLQFEKYKLGFLNKSTEIKITNYFKENILLETESKKPPNRESLIAKKLDNLSQKYISEYNPKAKNYLLKDYKVKNTIGVEFKFRFAWQNGAFNLVKPLSFDLSEARFISKKAHENYGLFVDLNQTEQKRIQRYKYHLIISKPSKKHLFKEFDHSINLLSNIKEVELFEDNNLKEYAKKLATSIVY